MRAHFISSIHDIDSEVWNTLCGTDYPFLRHEFFTALEDSGSTTKATGWQAHHLLIEDQEKCLLVMPLFLKYHSYGEYVFDWAWADAWHRYGKEYYPKLINAIPFTPATGPRWGIVHNLNEAEKTKLLDFCFSEIIREAKRRELSSCHWLFTPHDENAVFNRQGLLQRVGCQYHWLNKSYKDFDDFLSTFSSRKRKNLKKERQKVSNQNIHVVLKEGKEISKEEWQQFYYFYHLTYYKRSGRQGYLSKDFFPLLAQYLNEHLIMTQAYRQTTSEETPSMIAAALYFKDSHTLYGRYWGCEEEYDQLHFETCYYQGIDYAIRNGLQRFDPGAQGEHKIQRGFTPILSYSYHWVGNDQFAEAIQSFLKAETAEITHYQQVACERLPFKVSNQ